MSTYSLSEKTQARVAISAIFSDSPPVLVEVRFPKSATSPDWYLCETETEFDHILERLSPGAELHLSSVWDLKNVNGDVCLQL